MITGRAACEAAMALLQRPVCLRFIMGLPEEFVLAGGRQEEFGRRFGVEAEMVMVVGDCVDLFVGFSVLARLFSENYKEGKFVGTAPVRCQRRREGKEEVEEVVVAEIVNMTLLVPLRQNEEQVFRVTPDAHQPDENFTWYSLSEDQSHGSDSAGGHNSNHGADAEASSSSRGQTSEQKVPASNSSETTSASSENSKNSQDEEEAFKREEIEHQRIRLKNCVESVAILDESIEKEINGKNRPSSIDCLKRERSHTLQMIKKLCYDLDDPEKLIFPEYVDFSDESARKRIKLEDTRSR